MNLKVFANRNDSKGKKPFSGKKMEWTVNSLMGKSGDKTFENNSPKK
jgi:hypothetical protein